MRFNQPFKQGTEAPNCTDSTIESNDAAKASGVPGTFPSYAQARNASRNFKKAEKRRNFLLRKALYIKMACVDRLAGALSVSVQGPFIRIVLKQKALKCVNRYRIARSIEQRPIGRKRPQMRVAGPRH